MTDSICSQLSAATIGLTGLCQVTLGPLTGLVVDEKGRVPEPATKEQIAEFAAAFPGQVLAQDAEAKDVLVFAPSKGSFPKTVTGLSPDAVALTRRLAGAEVGDCSGDGLSLNHAILPGTYGGSKIQWDPKHLAELRRLLGAGPGKSFFCLDGTNTPDADSLSIGVRMIPENFSSVLGALKTLNAACGSAFDESHCGIVRETLNGSFRMFYHSEPPAVAGTKAREEHGKSPTWFEWLLFAVFAYHPVKDIIQWIIGRFSGGGGGGGGTSQPADQRAIESFARGAVFGSQMASEGKKSGESLRLLQEAAAAGALPVESLREELTDKAASPSGPFLAPVLIPSPAPVLAF
jgi:hypothetical protein